MGFGEALRKWRLEKKYSQKFAGQLVGVQQATWSEWEAEKSAPQGGQAVVLQRVTKGRFRVDMLAESAEESRARVERAFAERATRTGTEG